MGDLKLRKTKISDFHALHKMMSEYDVVKMTGSWPWPPDPNFTMSRLATPQAKSGAVSAIVLDGQYIGQVSVVNGELGYMLDKRNWGQGIATWAVREKLKMAFADPNLDQITAGLWADNKSSEAVLRKFGFVKTDESETLCEPRGTVQLGYGYALSRADWAILCALKIETDRLVIEPFLGSEASALSDLINDKDIARMMATIPHPFSEAQAAKWLAERPFCHSIEQGFVAKVSLHNGTLIGFCGIGGDPVNTAYAFGREYWGQGYATEAMRAFLAHCTRTFALKEITAGAMFDNPASAAVLEKLGFARVGEKQHKASGRLEKAQLFLYRKINH